MNQKQIHNIMKPMNQKQILSSKSSFLAVFLLLPMSSHAALTAWQSTPITVGDKTYQYLSSSLNLFNNASVNSSEAAGIHSFNLTNLAGSIVNDYLEYSIVINDPTNFFYANRTSENDILGNVTGGSTTTVYSDAFITPLNSTSLTGTQTGATYLTSGWQTFYVRTLITGVDGATNKISNVTFDVTQTNAIPEVTSSFSLLVMLSSGLLLRRRAKY